jgi:hypothetical protein
MDCPDCASSNTQRVPLVYESGTSTINTTTKTGAAGIFGTATGSGVAAVSNTTGTSQTATAARVAPPVPASQTAAMVMMALGAFFGLGMFVQPGFLDKIVAVVVFAAPLLYFGYGKYKKADEYNRTVYRSLRAQWEGSWLCHRCGHIYSA